MTTSKHSHGASLCACGTDVTDTSRLLSAADLATHLGVARGTISNAHHRATGQNRAKAGPPPPWWVDPTHYVGNVHAWSIEAAEKMRLARLPATDQGDGPKPRSVERLPVSGGHAARET